jgi:hypothetical protein
VDDLLRRPVPEDSMERLGVPDVAFDDIEKIMVDEGSNVPPLDRRVGS